MAVPEYRYIGVDLLTRQVIEDLPLYGTSFTRRISSAGNMTGSFKLGTGFFSDSDLLNATEPGLRALFALRNEQCFWAGPIWSRTYQSQASVCSLTGQTYESIFEEIKILSRIQRTDDQTLLLKYLIDTMQAQASCNFGIDTTGVLASGVNQSLTVETYEQKTFSEPIGDILKASNSFDYVIDYTMNPNTGNPQLVLKTGYPYLGYGQAGINVDYPGAVSNYFWPDSAAQGIVRETVMGKGEGTAMAVAEYTNWDLVRAGYPMWEKPRSEKSISDPVQLARIAEESGQTRKMPVTIPTLELELGTDDPDKEPVDFASWGSLGLPIHLNIQDDRFPVDAYPDGKTFHSRMLGWDYHPSSSEGTESLKIVLEGQS
jgi:hypothetical protein